MKKITVLIIEDHDTLRISLSSWVKDLFPKLSIHNSRTGEDGLTLVDKIKPNILIVDIGLPGINGIEVTKLTKKFSPKTQVIVLTMLDGANYENESLDAGAFTFINKRDMYNKLPSVLESILNDCKDNLIESK